jgi:prephenate dehydrogenase
MYMQTETVTIIGLDRISASIGLGLQANDLGLTIVGSDQDSSVGEQAKQLGAVNKLVGNPVSAAGAADILILNVSLAEQEAMLEAVAGEIRDHVLIIDLANLKSPGLKWAKKYIQQGHYVGASPVLAANSLLDGRFGVEAARSDLFKQSVFCIMPSANTDPKAVETAVNLGRILGATPFFLDPMEYDSLVLGVETTPGLLAAALFRAVTKSTGWRDMLRFAGLQFSLSTASLDSPDLVELALYDKEASLRWLDVVMAELEDIRRLVADGDLERAALIFQELSYERRRWQFERQNNDWTQVESPDLEGMSFTRQLFGFGPKKKDKKK